MKLIYLIVLIISLSINPALAKVKSKYLSLWYDGCMSGGIEKYNDYNKADTVCQCTIEIINSKLSTYQFETIFFKERWKTQQWLMDNTANCRRKVEG